MLADLEAGAYSLDCGEDDLPRIRSLASRYESLPLGYAAAAVIACAERCGGRVLTLDLRDFGVVAREGAVDVLPSAPSAWPTWTGSFVALRVPIIEQMRATSSAGAGARRPGSRCKLKVSSAAADT